ncbi:MAG TPA: ABC transporter substrate-binding protein [Stellaceae bacterium]|nr:ABC transporter substrate-binding protein [Stellaceae bacterium]
MSRAAAVLAILFGLALAASADAQSIKVGMLKSSGSGAAYLAQERGYFAAEGLSVEIVPFDSAQPIAVALASGDVDVSSTGFTAGFFSLAGKGMLRIIAGTTLEIPGVQFQPFLVSNRAYETGLRTFRDFPGHSFALSQIGSPTHYALGLIADKYGFDLKSMRLLALQSIGNTVSAIVGGQVDLTMMPGNTAVPLLQKGQAKLVGYVGDETPYQLAGVMVSGKTADTRGDMIRHFLAAYRKGAKDYDAAFFNADRKRVDEPSARAVAEIIGKHINQTADQVLISIAYVDPELRLDVKDTLHQLTWYQSQGMVKADADGNAIVDRRYAVPLPGN